MYKLSLLNYVGEIGKLEENFIISTYLRVTDPLKNNCKNNCLIANSQAMCGAISQMAPRKRLLPHNRKNNPSSIFKSKNTQVIPILK